VTRPAQRPVDHPWPAVIRAGPTSSHYRQALDQATEVVMLEAPSAITIDFCRGD